MLSKYFINKKACSGKLWQWRLSPILMNALNNSPPSKKQNSLWPGVIRQEGGVNERCKGGTTDSMPADRNFTGNGPKSLRILVPLKRRYCCTNPCSGLTFIVMFMLCIYYESDRLIHRQQAKPDIIRAVRRRIFLRGR